jgi:transposase
VLIKKTESVADTLSPEEENRLHIMQTVQKMLGDGFSYSDVAKETGICIRTVARYRTGDPQMMCRKGRPGRDNILDSIKDKVYALMQSGYHASGVYQQLVKEGYNVHSSTVRRYVRKMADEEDLDISLNHKGPTLEQKEEFHSRPKSIVIKKSEIQKHLWSHVNLKVDEKSLYGKYIIIHQLKKCIAQFREIFRRKSIPLLYIFIDNYKCSKILELKSFALGLEKDIEAIENAVSSDQSNGFVEGNNNRVKVIKRVMYGRCGLKLLTAKIMLGRQGNG